MWNRTKACSDYDFSIGLRDNNDEFIPCQQRTRQIYQLTPKSYNFTPRSCYFLTHYALYLAKYQSTGKNLTVKFTYCIQNVVSKLYHKLAWSCFKIARIWRKFAMNFRLLLWGRFYLTGQEHPRHHILNFIQPGSRTVHPLLPLLLFVHMETHLS